jgi:hypothetical protein
MLLDRLKVPDQEAWQLAAHHTIRLLHKFKGRNFALLLHLFGKEDFYLRAQPEFFERLVAILPVHVQNMKVGQVTDCLEVLTK